MSHRIRAGTGVAASVLLAAVVFQAQARAGSITGSARCREPVVLPADAVFEAVLVDAAIADAPARELGRVRLQPAGQPPFRFAIPYSSGDLSPAGRYTVRATVRQGERLLFSTDTFTPVLDGGPGRPLDLVMIQVASLRPPSPVMPRGRLPAGCHGARPAAVPIQPRLSLLGMFTYQADAARIRLCDTAASLPVAMEGDYRRLEQAYLQALPAGAAGRPLLVALEGLISERPSAEVGRPPERSLVVERFVAVHPGRVCPQAPGTTLDPGRPTGPGEARPVPARHGMP